MHKGVSNSSMLENLPVEALAAWNRNARTHDESQVAQLVASIREFGFTNPVLVDNEGTIIAGHGRVMAARKLGLESVPCLRLKHLTPEQLRAYVIADNRLAENAGWDLDMLASELDALRDADFDLGLLGFTQQELNDLIGTDTVPPPPEEPSDDSQTISFRLDAASFRKVRRALDKAKASPDDEDGQALVAICAAFMGRKQ